MPHVLLLSLALRSAAQGDQIVEKIGVTTMCGHGSPFQSATDATNVLRDMVALIFKGCYEFASVLDSGSADIGQIAEREQFGTRREKPGPGLRHLRLRVGLGSGWHANIRSCGSAREDVCQDRRTAGCALS